MPHSDPIIDGGVVQEASRRALEAGTRPADVFAMIADAALDVPVAVMTYANILARPGYDAFVDRAATAGLRGLIVPDLPVDESTALSGLAVERGIDVVLLAAPGTAPERYRAIGLAAHGFVYCVATYGVTGARPELATTAREVVAAMRPHTELPLLVGVGIATPEQAAAAVEFADGVIVGSALMSLLMAGDRSDALRLAGAFRSALGPSPR